MATNSTWVAFVRTNPLSKRFVMSGLFGLGTTAEVSDNDRTMDRDQYLMVRKYKTKGAAVRVAKMVADKYGFDCYGAMLKEGMLK